MTLARSFVAATIIASAMSAHAQQTQSPFPPATAGQAPAPTTQPPTTQTPASQTPGAPTSGPATLGTTLAPANARTFAAPVGMWFVTVRPERAADFEQVIAHLQDALARSTDPRTREQAKGWRILKASEPGPNSTVMYVFSIDATVAGADYGLGGILASAYPDTTALAEIWRMYTGAITGGGSLLNLTPIAPKIVPFGEKSIPIPVTPSAAPAPATAPPAPTTAAPAPAVPQP
jgi:hypothetical protein